MTKQSRRKFTSEFKTKVVIEALKERLTIEELSKKYEVHPSLVNSWKRDFLSKASVLFSDKQDHQQKQQEADTQQLYAQIGQLKVENDFLKKKVVVRPLEQRREMIEKDNKQISIVRQSELLGIHRSGLYYQPCPESEENLTIMRLLDEQYLKTPFYGVRRLTVWLESRGYQINRKRTRRLMELMGWQTI